MYDGSRKPDLVPTVTTAYPAEWFRQRQKIGYVLHKTECQHQFFRTISPRHRQMASFFVVLCRPVGERTESSIRSGSSADIEAYDKRTTQSGGHRNGCPHSTGQCGSRILGQQHRRKERNWSHHPVRYHPFQNQICR